MRAGKLFLCLLVVLALSACGRKALVLPDSGDIRSIEVSAADGEIAAHSDASWIARMLEALGGAKPTARQSVQDAPSAGIWLRVDFVFDEGKSTLFLYQEDGRFYAEQPY